MFNKFVVIDGSSLLYRAFYALPLLTTANGQYTNAVYGFAMMLVKLIDDLKPDTLVVAFDKGKKTFRNDLFAEYKGTRKPTPTELVGQIPLIHELVEAFGIKLVEEAGYEADDIIGTLATKAAMQGNEVIVVTGDRDALQLIGDNLKVMLTKKGISEMQLFDTATFKEKYGLEPIHLIDLKGLMGDSSDNIPGVPGVGEKTATKLLLEYGTIEDVLENIENISGKKLQEKLHENKELALLSKKLATIIRDMPIEYNEEECKITPDVLKLRSFCMKYEFRSVLSRLDQLFPVDDGLGFGTVIENLPPETIVIQDYESLEKVIEGIKKTRKFIFYPVFDGQIPDVTIKAMAIASQEDKMVYVSNTVYGWEACIDLFSDPTIVKITHDFKKVYQTKIRIDGIIFDTMLAAYLLKPTVNTYDLNALMEQYLDQYNHPVAFEKAMDQASWSALCINDLYEVLQEKLAEADLKKLYDDIEIPLLEVLAVMENTGIMVDRKKLESMSEEIAEKITYLLSEIYHIAGIEFNVNSTKQLGEILFDKLNLPVIKKTKRGYSTDAEVLEKLVDEHPIITKLLEYRTLTKLKSTYLDGLLILIHETSNRIHTNFNQMVTATGRLSSSEPNLQNIPVRTEAGKRIRELFIPGEGYHYLLSADYSQIELRVLAHMSGDKNFVEAFSHEQDVHTRTASEVFGVPMEQVTSELRSRAKAVNFGIVYGISDYGLSRDLNVTRKEAAQYIESYFDKCAGVKNFIDRVVEEAHQKGYVTTLFGRRRYLPDINSSNYNQRSFAERTAMNTPIQGSAADIIKKAMIDVYRELNKTNLKSRILLQVHDELLLEVSEDEVETVTNIVKKAMQEAIKLTVPLTVDVNVGKSWAQAK
ncbi:DNA polymerase I [Anaerosinus massiliensis]|uniref:DNA polymerase I n=1 Tax=Massilibacillus massiliensis TaxID=1806837 RepID=UPI000B1FCA78|nr:DNA polymerase I [Massilibacillus massiliensis]